ncbi:MAG: hypothetical protein RIT45_2440 [Pseudomonadota bacterium]|jgi:UDP-glucose 4-epimerase
MARRKRERVVVITGIAGRLGQLLTRRLHREEGVKVIGIDRRHFHRRPKDVEHHRIDIRRKATEDIFRTHRVETIYHLGLMHDPRQGQGEHFSWNVVGTQRIFEFAQRYNVPKVVLVSSADVYGPQSDNPAFLSEDSPLLGAQRFPQIRDLISVDMLAQSYFWKVPELETVVLRPVHILGGVKNAMSNYLRMARPPMLFGFDPMMQVLHEEDMASAIVAAALPGVRGVFNVVGPDAVPLSKLVELSGRRPIQLLHPIAPAIARQAFALRLIDAPSAELDWLRYAVTLDGSRIRGLLGYAHRYNARDAVAAAMRTDIFEGAAEAASSHA